MHHVERLNKLLEILKTAGCINISQQARAMDVSIATLHRDINKLAQEGIINKTRGGAVFTEKKSPEIYSYDMRLRTAVEEKREIARNAVGYIQDNSSIFIDHSSSCAFLISEILEAQYQNLNIITNSLVVPLEILGKQGVQVLVTGGLVNSGYKACYGKWVSEFLRQTNVHQIFVSAGSISEEKGLMTQQSFIVELYETLLSLESQINILVDSSKFSKIQTFQITPISNSFRIFSDKKLPNSLQERFLERGCNIIT